MNSNNLSILKQNYLYIAKYGKSSTKILTNLTEVNDPSISKEPLTELKRVDYNKDYFHGKLYEELMDVKTMTDLAFQSTWVTEHENDINEYYSSILKHLDNIIDRIILVKEEIDAQYQFIDGLMIERS